MGERLVFTGKQQVRVEAFEAGTPGEGEVLVRNVCTLMSIGTENIVFNRLFDPGTHWDQWVAYPFYPGYSAVGEIVAVGLDVGNRSVGQLVAHRGSHASERRCKAGDTYPVPAALAPDVAVWFALAKIAFMGAKAVRYGFGDCVLVAGAPAPESRRDHQGPDHRCRARRPHVRRVDGGADRPVVLHCWLRPDASAWTG